MGWLGFARTITPIVCAGIVLVSARADAQDAGAPQPPAVESAAPPSTSSQTTKAKAKKDSEQPKPHKKAGKHKKTGSDEASTADSGDEPSEPGQETVKQPKHPTWHIGDAATVDFKTRIETEFRGPTQAMGLDQEQFDWQDRRVGIQGTAFKRVSFEVSRELSDDFEAAHDLSEKTRWRDAYVDVRLTKHFSVEGGRFKLPFGREELTGETNLDFVHRSLAARVLSPGRDVGVMAHGRALGRAFSYQAGYFTRDGDNGRTSETKGGDHAFAARVVSTPFARTKIPLLAPLAIGVDVEASRMPDRLGLRGRTVLGDGIFFDRVYVNGPRRRIGGDVEWASGPVALSSEYIAVAEDRRGMGFDGEDLPHIGAQGWNVAGAWAITGEQKRGRLEPAHDFLRGGVGAVELVARIERLNFATAIFPGALSPGSLAGNSDHASTIGINWYLNHYFKLEGDVIMESIADPERSPAPSADGRFTSTVVLLQFRF